MKKINKEGIVNIFYENRILLLISYVLIIFTSIQDRMIYKDLNISIFDFLLLMYADHYNTMYFILPMVLLVIAKDIREINDVEILRYRNMFEYTSKKVLEFSVFIFLHISLIFFIRFIFGLGYFSFYTTLKSIDFTGVNEVFYIFNIYADYFNNGFLAVICAVLYLDFGLIFFYALLSNINQMFSYKLMVGVGIFIFLMSYIGFKFSNSRLAPVFLNNYLLIHQGLFSNSIFIFGSIIAIGIFTISYSFIKSYVLIKGE